MAGTVSQSGRGITLAPLRVRPTRAEFDEFAAALGLSGGAVPLTFPIRWMVLPPVRKAIEDLIGLNPVHVSQSFAYDGELESERDYVFTVSIQPDSSPARRLSIRGTVSDPNGRTLARCETILVPTLAAPQTASPNAPEHRSGTLPDIALGPIAAPQVARYAQAAHDDNRLHRDAEFARSVGFEGPIVHGMLVMGLLQKALAEWRMDSRVAKLSALFTRPLAMGSRIVIVGRTIDPRPGQRIQNRVVRLFVRREQGEVVCIGEAVLAPNGAAAS